jgi:hypothetical protein
MGLRGQRVGIESEGEGMSDQAIRDSEISWGGGGHRIYLTPCDTHPHGSPCICVLVVDHDDKAEIHLAPGDLVQLVLKCCGGPVRVRHKQTGKTGWGIDFGKAWSVFEDDGGHDDWNALYVEIVQPPPHVSPQQ